MISVYLKDDVYKYEIEDVLKLFFEGHEIEWTKTEPRYDNRGVFLVGRYTYGADSKAFRIDIKAQSFYEFLSVPVKGRECNKDRYEESKAVKRSIKQFVYSQMVKIVEKKLPWGILTGIRPAKIVHEMLEKGLEHEGVIRALDANYDVSRPKAELLYNVAMVESDILKRTDRNKVGLYIGIPFCTSRCLYCSFTSNPINKCRHLVADYMAALKSEIEGTAAIIKDKGYKIQSVYIGGGTPTSIDVCNLRALLDEVQICFDLDGTEEVTLEAGRPDSIDEEKLDAIKNSRVTRISINPQTMNDETLKLIGRNHTSEDIVKAFEMARNKGFGNINMDVIVGLPGENIYMFRHTLDEIERLGPESLTVHTMALKRASRLSEEKDRYKTASVSDVAKMVEMAQDGALSMGMHAYYLYRQKNMIGNLENVGYCKPGFESVYNVQIMEERQSIIALGAGATTKVVYYKDNKIERVFNVKDIRQYIQRVGEMLDRKRDLLDSLNE